MSLIRGTSRLVVPGIGSGTAELIWSAPYRDRSQGRAWG